MRLTVLPLAAGALASGAAGAADVNVSVEVPKIDVAAYHRPYVAIFIENKEQKFASNLAVWYQVKSRNNNAEGPGEKWLKDLRLWWRKSGRELSFPMDGLTSATRPVGTHKVSFTEGKGTLAKLPAGEYRLVVEAAREEGGREVVAIPFTWPPKAASEAKQQGKDELGLVTLELKP